MTAKNPPAVRTPRTKTDKGWQARWFHFAVWVVILSFFIMFLRAVEPILLPFVLGMLVAYLMDPVVGKLQKMKVSRSAATAIVTIGLFALRQRARRNSSASAATNRNSCAFAAKQSTCGSRQMLVEPNGMILLGSSFMIPDRSRLKCTLAAA